MVTAERIRKAPQVNRVATRAVTAARAQLDFELRAMARHRVGLSAARRHEFGRGIKLNLGCGGNVKPGWINIDLFHESAELALDLREIWPIPDGAAALIYSEHFFEHLEHPTETGHYLAEAFRVLEPGGRISIGVPDTEWPIIAYSNQADNYWKLAKELWHPRTCETRIDHLNYHFRQEGEHKFAWDCETLERVVSRAGFIRTHKRGFCAGLDSPARQIGTLYVDATKPS